MTNSELQMILKDLPPDLPIYSKYFVREEISKGYKYQLVEQVFTEKMRTKTEEWIILF